MVFSRITQWIKSIRTSISEAKKKTTYVPFYRVTEIVKSDEDYIVTVQLINKNIAFSLKPEEILADDNLVDQFSPRDIRTLTYLGYLGINSPKYKILAQRLSEEHDKLVFALQKKGTSEILIKTAEEIHKEKEILNSLAPQDAHTVGYSIANESMVSESKRKAQAVSLNTSPASSSKDKINSTSD